MKILAFINKNSGPCYHRITAPFMLMPDVDVLITNDILEEQFDGINLFVYNRILPDEAVEKIYKLREQKGFKIVVDIDDYWYLDERHILYDYYKEIDFANKQIYQLNQANFVFVTNERLAEQVLQHNWHCYVLPNAIPKQGQFAEVVKTKSKEVRLFWQGSITHKQDLKLIQPVMARLSNSTLNVRGVLAGYEDTEPEWKHMALMYTAFGKLKYSLVGGLHITAYYQVYQEADICIIPLVESQFNSMKSNLKILEAANLGLPVIASNVHPYKGMPVLYAESSNEWYMHIRDLVKDKRYRYLAGQKLKDYCDLHYNFETINSLRKQIIEDETRK